MLILPYVGANKKALGNEDVCMVEMFSYAC